MVQAVRTAVGSDFPLLIKLNSEDFSEPGLTVDDMLEIAGMLATAGVTAIELSGGLVKGSTFSPIRPGPVPPVEDVYYRAAARRFKADVRIPLILVGGIRRLATASELVAEGTTDLVALCRPLICEPDLVARWRNGTAAAAACISCNRCLRIAITGHSIICAAREKTMITEAGTT